MGLSDKGEDYFTLNSGNATTASAHPLVISRDSLNGKILGYIEGIKQKFTYKNGNYGSDSDPLNNFRDAARNVLGEESADNMYKSLLIYIEKHMSALRKNGLNDSEFSERYTDVIVYSLISMAMKEIYDEQEGNK